MNVEGAAARYLESGRVAHGFARGKMRGDPVYARVLHYVRAGDSVLAVGCGEGYLLALLHENVGGVRMMGLDHDARRVELAGRALAGVPDCRVWVADARTSTLPSADVVTCLDVLHYQSPEEQDALLARLASAVNPGGVLLVRDGRADGGFASWITWTCEKLAVAVGRHRGDGVYFRPLAELQTAFTSLGLEVTHDDCNDHTPFANVLFVARKPA